MTQTVEPKVLSSAVEPVGPPDHPPAPAKPRVVHPSPVRDERVPPPHEAAIVIGSHPDPVSAFLQTASCLKLHLLLGTGHYTGPR